ncbi:hypothetical protein MBANPS3_009685 [Mucor bainieri]
MEEMLLLAFERLGFVPEFLIAFSHLCFFASLLPCFILTMSESRIKRLWKNRISQQLSGFHISTCIAPTNQVDHQEGEEHTAKANAHTVANTPPPALPQHHTPLSTVATSPQKKLWRKPLPNDCPSFDFEISEKTIIEQDASLIIIANKEIPTRIQSRHYENIPNLEAQLERACKNEKAVLLTKLLEKQRHQQKQCT